MAPITDSTRTALPMTESPKADIEYELFLDCVHCGLCTSACPTYVELGTEMDSPRGRIYLMRGVTDGKLSADDPHVQRHLDLCLDCRACETACPSGVQYGRLIEPYRIHQAKTRSTGAVPSSPLQQFFLFHLTPYNWRTRMALLPMRVLQYTGMDRLVDAAGLQRLLPRSLRQLQEMVPKLQSHYGRLPEVLPAEGPRRARVALFLGCAGDAFFPQTTLATARVLQKNGCEVWIPRQQNCCGALHYHAAQEQPARKFAASNCTAFAGGAGGWKGVDAIISNAAGCGAMLKDYGHLLHDHPEAEAGATFAAKVRDISEFLMELGPVKPEYPLRLRATYHDACHLCHAQKIRTQPRQLLEMIPELQLLSLNESEICCGAAGSYNITQPEMAERLGKRKVRNILDTGAQAVFTANVGCMLQVMRHLKTDRPDLWVAHPVDALWAAYTGQTPPGFPAVN